MNTRASLSPRNVSRPNYSRGGEGSGEQGSEVLTGLPGNEMQADLGEELADGTADLEQLEA